MQLHNSESVSWGVGGRRFKSCHADQYFYKKTNLLGLVFCICQNANGKTTDSGRMTAAEWYKKQPNETEKLSHGLFCWFLTLPKISERRSQYRDMYCRLLHSRTIILPYATIPAISLMGYRYSAVNIFYRFSGMRNLSH